MLKSIVSIFLVYLCFAQLSMAQDTLDIRNTELSINANRFVKQFLSFSDNQLIFDEPFLISLHVPVGSKSSYFRAGFGASYLSNKIDNTDSNGNSFKRNARSADVNLRVGIESRKVIHSKFKLHYGVDLVFLYENNKTDSQEGNEFVSTFRSLGAGMGPVLGVSFLINDKISLWTESSMYLVFTDDKQESSFSPTFTDTQTSSSVRAQITEPLSIHFRVSF